MDADKAREYHEAAQSYERMARTAKAEGRLADSLRYSAIAKKIRKDLKKQK